MSHIPEPAARQVSQFLAELAWPNAEGQTRPHRDALLQGASFKHSFGRPAHIVRGTIVDYTAIAHCYKVQLSQGMPTVAAFQLTDTSTGPIGPKQINLLQVGTGVWVMMTERGRYGYILGVDPAWAFDSRLQLLDQLSQTTRARVDSSHRTPLLMFEAGGAVNKIAWRPFDGLGGDAGWLNAKGGKISIDDYLLQLAASEMCGVFAFHHDQMLRVAGYNYECRTSAGEHNVYNDQDEIYDVYGSSPYPWENLGLFSRGDPRRELSVLEFQVNKPHYANWEPKFDDQAPFHRRQVFGGYLGQGRLEYQAIPPASPPEVMRRGSPPKLMSVHQDVVTLDGWRGIRASKGILLVKSPPRPMPVNKRNPADPTGDAPTNYKAGGMLGDGPEHKVTGDIATSSDEVSLQTAAGILDLHAHLFNWQAEHPFHYHSRDWELPQESDIPACRIAVPQFGTLRGSMYLSPVVGGSLTVDDRYRGQTYYANMAYSGLLPSGAAVMGDGEGAEIRLAGGSVFITAPGDIWLKSGRNVNTWAGWDSITRAQNSFDITATNHDGRIKAQRHLHMLGGVGPDSEDAEATAPSGSVLIECRSQRVEFDFTSPGQETEASGIIFRAPKSDVVTTANNIYLRTGSNNGAITPGSIVLDADRGKQSIVCYAANMRQYIGQTSDVIFGTEGNFRKGITFNEGVARFGMPVSIDGALTTGGAILAGSHVLVANGHIATQRAESSKFFVSPLKDQALEEVRQQIDAAKTAVGATLLRKAKDNFDETPKDLFYSEGQIGSDPILKAAQFSFRNEGEYRTGDWRLFEDRWQQLARESGQKLGVWVEKPVKTVNGGTRYPYPGTQYYDSVAAYCEQPVTLFSVVSGFASPRGGAYEEPAFAEPNVVLLRDGYAIIADE